MKRIAEYIKEIIGLEVEIHPLEKAEMDKFPIYLKEVYFLQNAVIGGRTCILAEMKEKNAFGTSQMEKNFEVVKKITGLPVIAIFYDLEAYNRKRLIEKKIAFVVIDKQLYIPQFFIDLKEYGITAKKGSVKLIPTAQQILLAHLLNKEINKRFENKTFKELAVLFETNPMGITRAAENLKNLELINISGGKEKFIQFRLEKHQLWNEALNRNLLINPVLKKIFVDEKPTGILMLHSNTSALPEYTDMNPSRQEFFALEKNAFYGLKKSSALVNANEQEGRYCLEIWKYNPEILVGEHNNKIVDPLSLYLSLKDSQDERIEMAMEQIINQFTW